MSVFVVTTDYRLLEYPLPAHAKKSKSIWLRDCDPVWKIYWKTCSCADCVNIDGHEVVIAWIEKREVMSIGFQRPIAIDGRLLTDGEKRKLTDLKKWLEQNKKVPKRLDISPLAFIAK